jgi:hypothetical protein
MSWNIYEFLVRPKVGVIEVWLRQARIQKKAKTLLNQKLDLLEMHGPNLPPELLAGPIDGHIYKLRIRVQRVQLRPLLCRGPLQNNSEFTLLCGATERDDELVPTNVVQQAEQHRQIILSDPQRRQLHEHDF